MDSAQLSALSTGDLLELITDALCILHQRFTRFARAIRASPEPVSDEPDVVTPAFSYTISCADFRLECIPGNDGHQFSSQVSAANTASGGEQPVAGSDSW